MLLFTPDRIDGPEPVASSSLVVYHVDIGDGRQGRVFAAEHSIHGLDAAEQKQRVCAALNSFVTRTSLEDVDDHLTGLRGIYLNELELNAISSSRAAGRRAQRPLRDW
jgi:hypothetical protein